jgi:hypothetical protein
VFDWADVFVRPVHYKLGSHDAPRFVLLVAMALGFICLRWARDIAVTSTVLQPALSRPSISLAFGQTLRTLPTLLPFALLTEFPPLIPSLWRDWSGFGRSVDQMIQFSLLVAAGALICGLLVTLSWGLIVPVVVAEQEGLVLSLGRAWRLLSGDRWRFLALFVAILVAGALPGMIGTAVVLPIIRSMVIHGLDNALVYVRIETAVTGILGVIVIATWQVTVAVAYLELRRLKEGVVLGDVAEIFA